MSSGIFEFNEEECEYITFPPESFKISPTQQKFLECPPTDPKANLVEQALFGGLGSGKTSIACIKCILIATSMSGRRGVIARATLADLKASTQVTFFELCPEELIAYNNRSENFTHLYAQDGGVSEIQWLGIDTKFGNGRLQMRSRELDFFFIDEVNELRGDVFLMVMSELKTRLLRRGSGRKYYAMVVGNPDGRNTQWKYFNETNPELKQFLTIPTYENPKEGISAYVEMIRKMYPPDICKMLIEGSCDVALGLIYNELSPTIHFLDDIPTQHIEFLREFQHYLAIDINLGPTGIAAAVWAYMDYEGNLVCYDEVYLEGKQIWEFASYVKERMAENRSMGIEETLLIDPATKAKTIQGEAGFVSPKQILEQELFGEEGTILPAINEIHGGILKVKKFIHPNPDRVSLKTGTSPGPQLYFVQSKVPNTIKEALAWSWGPPDRTGKIMPRKNQQDHAIDCVRYIVSHVYRPEEKKEQNYKDLDPIIRIGMEKSDYLIQSALSNWRTNDFWGEDVVY